MGAFSEIDIDQQCGKNNDACVDVFRLEQEPLEQPDQAQEAQIRFEDDALQQAEADAAPQEMAKLMKGEAPPPALSKPAEEVDEDKAQKAHEEAEAKRRAEWEARQAAKKAEQEKQLQMIAAMSEEELLAASAKRLNEETERLTRRNMKEYVSEHIQTLCLDDLEFARLTMLPRKSFMHCIWYINRKAREYLEQEIKNNGMQRPHGTDGIYGGDVPDEIVYQWAEDYYRDTDAPEDKEKDDQFEAKPYAGPVSSKSRKKAATQKASAPKKAEKPQEVKVEEKEPVDENQISFGAFLKAAGKAS